MAKSYKEYRQLAKWIFADSPNGFSPTRQMKNRQFAK